MSIETGSQVETEIMRVLFNSNAKRRPLQDCLKNLGHLPYGFIWATIEAMVKEGQIVIHRLDYPKDLYGENYIELELI